MKKLFFTIFAILTVFTCAAHASEVASVPDFEVRLNGTLIDNDYREYPLLQYKGVTYFPMTYYDCRFLGLVTEWDNDTRTLSIRKENISGMYRGFERRYFSYWGNDGMLWSHICEFNITVNGSPYNADDGEHPFLVFRDVTYMPLTWELVHDEFGWEYSFSDEGGLVIDSGNYHTEILDLPGYGKITRHYVGGGSRDVNTYAATDGAYYYYQAADGNLYRAPVDDIASAELFFRVPPDEDNGLNNPAIVIFMQRDGQLYMKYQTYAEWSDFTGTTHCYAINDNGFNEVDYYEMFKNIVQPVVRRESETMYYFEGMSLRLDETDGKLYYIRDGEEAEVQTGGKDICGIGAYRDCLYYTCCEDDSLNLYCAVNYGVPVKVAEGISYVVDRAFTVQTGPSGDMCYMLLFSRYGALYRWQSDTGEVVQCAGSVEGLTNPIFLTVSGEDVLLVSDNEDGLIITSFSDYGTGDEINTLFKASEKAKAYRREDAVFAALRQESSGIDARFIVIGRDDNVFVPYISADVPDEVFVHGKILLYNMNGITVKVELK